MKRLHNWCLEQVHCLKLYADVIFYHIAASFYMIIFLLERRVLYNGSITYDLLQKFKWGHIIELKRWISNDKYLALCKSIFDCTLDHLKASKRVKICCVVYVDTTWSCADLYRLLDEDKRFYTGVLVVPVADYERSFQRIKAYYVDKGYRLFKLEEHEWEDSNIFIYQNPYAFSTKKVNIENRKLSELCMMIPYAIFQGDGADEHLEGDENRKCRGLWRYYCYTDDSFQYGLRHSSLGSVNMKFSGYPKMDSMYSTVQKKPGWHGDGKWKILFAPTLAWKYSVFMDVWKIMLQIAEEEKDISWIFRPHPSLGVSLIHAHQLESIEEYEEYVEQWRQLPNASVEIGGDYADTFKTSDAMIADGNSFLTNYQYVHKPLLFLRGGKNYRLTQYGRELYDVLYISDGDYKRDICRFVKEVVRDGNDVLKENRDQFFNKNLDYKKRNGMLASEFIYKDLCISIFGDDTE